MGWPFVEAPKEKPVFGRELPRRRKAHAYFSPFGYPIKLCIWEYTNNEIQKTEEITCKHCIRDLKRLMEFSGEASK